MNNIFTRVKKELERQYGANMPSLRFVSLGAAMIHGLPFKFDIDNVGDESDKGLCVAISGDSIENGSFTVKDITLNCFIGGRQTTIKKKLSLVEKKDGKHVYQAKFSDITLQSGLELDKDEEKRFEQKLKRQLHFSFTPCYTDIEDGEVMLTVYPYANILEGAANKYRNVCADESSLIKYL
ncbi:MAG: hypothetical protein J6A55_04190 [Oscillospiraceae bacterium]|nr:hypothetical protein [Oscillospiraceae bacterium]